MCTWRLHRLHTAARKPSARFRVIVGRAVDANLRNAVEFIDAFWLTDCRYVQVSVFIASMRKEFAEISS